MKRQKRKSLTNQKIRQKLFLAAALSILLCSRIVSSVAAIQQVQTSFLSEQTQAHIPIPQIAAESTSITSHIEVQQKYAGDRDAKLQQISAHAQKVTRIQAFYRRWNSPMAAHADYIVITADKFGVDWRLIPAVSIVESSGGVHCFKSYNAFGWGSRSFASFEQAIYTVTEGIATGYRTSNPYYIAPRYNPVTPDAWANKVSGLMGQI